MKGINITDVTLRDGGYKTNFHFKDQQVEKIILALDQAGIDYIEVGYRNGTLRPMSNIGNAGLCRREYLTNCRNLIRKAKLTVMLHPKNVNDEDLNELLDCGVDLVRVCIFKNNYEESRTIVDKIKKLGLAVSANITRVSQYTEKELDHLVSLVSGHNVDMIYFADSNGSMLPSKTRSIYEKYVQQYPIPFGFHAHDNLGLAQTNVLAALSGGAQYIDASLCGMGKGIGNLKTEIFVAYLQAINIKKYNISETLNISNFVRSIGNNNAGITIQELMMGISDLSIDDIVKLKIPDSMPVC